MCNLCSIATNQAAIAALFRVVNRYVGNLAPMPGVFPDYPAPVIRNTDAGREMTLMRWGMPPPPRKHWLKVKNRTHPAKTGRAEVIRAVPRIFQKQAGSIANQRSDANATVQ